MTKTYRGVDGVEYRELIKPKRIEIARVEGPKHLCDKLQGCAGWRDADRTLRLNSATAPKTGGCDKHAFKVIFEDGLEYHGCYDLKHWSVEPPDLVRHIRSFLIWCAYSDRARTLLKPHQIEAAREMLERYDVELDLATSLCGGIPNEITPANDAGDY
jgi:hypothetical protein